MARSRRSSQHSRRTPNDTRKSPTRSARSWASTSTSQKRASSSRSPSAWDGPLAALVAALEEDPERYEKVADAIGEELGVDVDEPKKSELLALTLRVGFQHVATEEMDALREAVREDATKGL